jgi:glycosyltransferase involved in cell wall biosynthesis
VAQEWGGTETVVLQTSRSLIEQGHPTAVWCPAILSRPGPDEMDGVPIRRFPSFYPYVGLSQDAIRRLDHKGGNLFSCSLAWSMLREPGLDLIHLHTGKRLGGIVRAVARQRKIPYVVSLHGGSADIPGAEQARFLEPTQGCWEWGKVLGWMVGSRRVLDDAAIIFCVGKEEARLTAMAHPHQRVEYLPNGVDPNRHARGDGPAFRNRHGIPDNARMLLTVGRMDPQKNQLALLNRFPNILKNVPDAYLMMIGPSTNDDYARQVRERLAENDIQGRAQWLPGFPPGSPELTDAYHSAQVFVLPSVHEPFGIVVLEAWSAGLPVVASNVGGIPGFVESGQDGILVPPQDDAQWIEALAGLLQYEDRSKALAQAGQNKAVSEYSWHAVTNRLVQLYEEAIRAHSLRK